MSPSHYSQEEGRRAVSGYLESRRPAVDRFLNEVVAVCTLCKEPVKRNQSRRVIGRSITNPDGRLVHIACNGII